MVRNIWDHVKARIDIYLPDSILNLAARTVATVIIRDIWNLDYDISTDDEDEPILYPKHFDYNPATLDYPRWDANIILPSTLNVSIYAARCGLY